MKRQHLDKRSAQLRHSKKRLRERFSLAVTTEQLNMLTNQIRSGQAQFLVSQSLRVSAWRVYLPIYSPQGEQQTAIALYDEKRDVTITFLKDDPATEQRIRETVLV